jgi:hypothetical protein
MNYQGLTEKEFNDAVEGKINIYIADEGKEYAVVDFITGNKLKFKDLAHLVEFANSGDIIVTEVSRVNVALEERSRIDERAAEKSIKMYFIDTRAISNWVIDTGVDRSKPWTDWDAVEGLRQIVMERRVNLTTQKNNKNHTQLNTIREIAENKAIYVRRSVKGNYEPGLEERDRLIKLVGECIDPFLSDGKIHGRKAKYLKYNLSRVIPIIIAAEETVKAGRGFKFFKELMGLNGHGARTIFRSNINYHWLPAYVNQAIKKDGYEGSNTHKYRKQFYAELKSALRNIFNQVKNQVGTIDHRSGTVDPTQIGTVTPDLCTADPILQMR